MTDRWSHCRSDDCLLHLLILRPPSFGIGWLPIRPSLHTRRPYWLLVSFGFKDSLDRWPCWIGCRVIGVSWARSTKVLHSVHSRRWSCSSKLLSMRCWGCLWFLLRCPLLVLSLELQSPLLDRLLLCYLLGIINCRGTLSLALPLCFLTL